MFKEYKTGIRIIIAVLILIVLGLLLSCNSSKKLLTRNVSKVDSSFNTQEKKSETKKADVVATTHSVDDYNNAVIDLPEGGTIIIDTSSGITISSGKTNGSQKRTYTFPKGTKINLSKGTKTEDKTEVDKSVTVLNSQTANKGDVVKKEVHKDLDKQTKRTPLTMWIGIAVVLVVVVIGGVKFRDVASRIKAFFK